MNEQTAKQIDKSLVAELASKGAWCGRREDRHGETKSGWWIDDVYLGKTERDAMEAIKG